MGEFKGGVIVEAVPLIMASREENDTISIVVVSMTPNFKEVERKAIEFPAECLSAVIDSLLKLKV